MADAAATTLNTHQPTSIQVATDLCGGIGVADIAAALLLAYQPADSGTCAADCSGDIGLTNAAAV